MNIQRRVAAVHDLSGFGKCSLTVALPVLSAAGLECACLPTAVLSTHTGGFEGFTYRDLTQDIAPMAHHWKTLDLHFDAMYSGFLGSFEQLRLVSDFFDAFRTEDNLIFVDPVMADHGALYSIFTPEFPKGMAGLCSKADIIVPNMTEAAMLLGEPFLEAPYTREYIETTLRRLAELGAKKIVLTGVAFDGELLGVACYDREAEETGYVFSEKIPGFYHGTGDVFASALLAALLKGMPLAKAARVAVDFTTLSIRRTREAGTDVRYGVNFEQGIPQFIKDLGLYPTK